MQMIELRFYNDKHVEALGDPVIVVNGDNKVYALKVLKESAFEGFEVFATITYQDADGNNQPAYVRIPDGGYTIENGYTTYSAQLEIALSLVKDDSVAYAADTIVIPVHKNEFVQSVEPNPVQDIVLEMKQIKDDTVAAGESAVQEINGLTTEFDAQVDAANTVIDEKVTEAYSAASDAENAASSSAASADNSLSSASASSAAKDVTAQLKSDTEILKSTAETAANNAGQSEANAQYWASLAQQWVTSAPKTFYVMSVDEMNALNTMKQFDLCYVISTVPNSATQCYVYDTTDIDADEVNPEWIFLGYLESFKQVAWADILNKPNFATVATSGRYPDLLDKPLRYEQFTSVTNGILDFAVTDKFIMTGSNLVRIDNLTNGGIVVIKTTLDLTANLPVNSIKPYDWALTPIGTGTYIYTCLYDGVNYQWNRAVYV